MDLTFRHEDLMKLRLGILACSALAFVGTAHAQLRDIPGLGLGAPSESDTTNAATPEPGAVVVYDGRIVINFNISVQSAVPAGSRIACGATAYFEDTSGLIEESAGVFAAQHSNTATCTVIIPYSWRLTSAGSDRVTINYELTIGAANSFSRESLQPIAVIPVPTNGATTAENVNAVL